MTAAPDQTALTNVTGGEVVVAGLAAHGVDVVFGIPGTHNLMVFDALDRYGVRTVATTHEQGAGYAADAYARTGRRPGVAVVTSGPAVYNAATAVAQAYSDSVPLLLVSPGMPLDHPTGGPGLGYLHEAKDQTGAMARIAEQCVRPRDHQGIADGVAAAFLSFRAGRPRPVHLEVPLDLLEARGDAAVDVAPTAVADGPDPVNVAQAAELLAGAARPMVVAGGGAVDAAVQVRMIAERLGAPVVTTTNGKGVLPEDHPLSLGARLHAREVRDALDGSDALLVVGSELGNSDLWFGPLQPSGPVIRVDVDARMADVNVASEVFIAGFAPESLLALIEALSDRVPVDRESAAWVRELRTTAIEASAQFGAVWVPWLAAIAGAMTEDTVVVADNAMCVYYGAIPNLPARRPASFLFPTGFGTLGYTVPAAVGAALAAPARPVVGISGDGGLLFTVPELAVAAAERLPMTIVVFDNSGYGEIRNEMLDRGQRSIAVSAPPRDLVMLATSLGAYAVRVADPEDLAAELAAAGDRPGPTVVVVPETPREA